MIVVDAAEIAMVTCDSDDDAVAKRRSLSRTGKIGQRTATFRPHAAEELRDQDRAIPAVNLDDARYLAIFRTQ